VRNVESKFRYSDHAVVLRRALDAGARDEGLLQQRDQFYLVPQGRLKLRTFGDGRGELIAYDREDVARARVSDYSIYTTGDPLSLAELLGRALPRAGSVEKRRHLLILRHTRIHLDDVVGLGRFVELETVADGITEGEPEEEHTNVVGLLDLVDAARIDVAYVDLMTSDQR
jgi:adenylate cyclase class IV